MKFGADARSPRHLKQRMEEAGFVDVQEHILKLPVGPWPRDPRLKKCGLFEMVNMTDGISGERLTFSQKCTGRADSLPGLTMMLFTRCLEWTPAEVEVFLAQVRKDAKDKRIHSYYNLYGLLT